MKKIKIIAGVISVCLLAAGIYGCNKESKPPGQTAPVAASTESAQQSSRMGTTGGSGSPPSQLYAVGNAPARTFLYSLSTPPGVLSASLISGFFVGTKQVTNATGIAFTNDTIIISTGASSNQPNKLLIYPYPSSLTAPIIVPCPNITDIEYDEYNNVLYGILGNLHIVSINITTGATTLNFAPTVPPGRKVTGLCNYNALLSYCLSDGTPAPDDFYTYDPTFGAYPLTFQFSTDWDGPPGSSPSHGAGTQFVDGSGWEIITSGRFTKQVGGIPLIIGTFSAMPAPGSAIFADVTSD